MKIITICIFLCAFFLLRPYHLQNSGMCYSGDDQSYFAHSTSIVFGQFPSYDNEHFIVGMKSPMHSVGPGLMAVPFVFMFSIIDRLTNPDFALKRTSKNIAGSWSLFGFVISAVFYLWMACFLLYKGVELYVDKFYVSMAVVFAVLCQGIPLFVYRRPVFSHIFEFFLQSLLVFLLLRQLSSAYPLKNYNLKLLFLGVVSGFVILVRYNNIAAAVFWPILIVYISHREEKKFKPLFVDLSKVFVTMGVFVGLFKILPDIYNGSQGYGGVVVSLLNLQPPGFYLRRLFHVIFGIDWGLLYTAPFLLLGIAVLFIRRFKHRKIFALCILPLMVNLYIVLMWKTQGGWYGYRYLTASALPIVVYPLALFFSSFAGKYGKKINIVWVLIAFFPVFSMISFEGNNSVFTLRVAEQYFGESGWGNNTYQLEIWKMLFLGPYELVFAWLKGGLLYAVYIILEAFNMTHKLPGIILIKYPVFRFDVLIKTIIIYILPFTLYLGVAKRYSKYKFKPE